MKRSVFAVCIAAAASATGCASTGTAPASAAAAPSSERRNPNLITRDELADPALGSLNVYDVIRTLRPNFLITRGAHTFNMSDTGQPHASIDGGTVGSLDDLKQLQAKVVLEIRYLDAAAAMQRFGATAREGPVIVVRTM